MLLDFIAVQVDTLKAAETSFSSNAVVGKDVYYVEMSNGNLSNLNVAEPLQSAQATITLSDDGFTQILLSQARLPDLIEAGEAKLTGDGSVLQKLAASLVEFNSEFEIVPFSDKTVDTDLYH